MIEASTFLLKHPICIDDDEKQVTQAVRRCRSQSMQMNDETSTGNQAVNACQTVKKLNSSTFGKTTEENPESKHYKSSRYKKRHKPIKAGGFGYRGGSALGQGVADPYDEQACKESGFTLLEASNRPRKALVDRLLAKGYDFAVVEKVVDRFEELNLVNDHTYAETYLRYCLKRNLGERGTLQEMLRKGVNSSVATDVVTCASQEGVFTEAAYSLGMLVKRKSQGMSPSIRLRRFWTTGCRKGHCLSDLQDVANNLFADNETV